MRISTKSQGIVSAPAAPPFSAAPELWSRRTAAQGSAHAQSKSATGPATGPRAITEIRSGSRGPDSRHSSTASSHSPRRPTRWSAHSGAGKSASTSESPPPLRLRSVPQDRRHPGAFPANPLGPAPNRPNPGRSNARAAERQRIHARRIRHRSGTGSRSAGRSRCLEASATIPE